MNSAPKCPICSGNIQPWSTPLKDIYNAHGLGVFCDECGDKANSFLSYWGEKNQIDKEKLFNFVNCGDVPARKFSAMMNGGYFNE